MARRHDEDDSWLSFSSLWLAVAGQSDEWPDAIHRLFFPDDDESVVFSRLLGSQWRVKRTRGQAPLEYLSLRS